MMDQEDKDLRELMKQLSDVPFRTELKARILDQVREPVGNRIEPRRKRRSYGRYFAVASGLVAACLVGAVAILHDSGIQIKTTADTKTVPFNESAAQFGLKDAPVQVSNVRVGTTAGDPKNSDVLADVTNNSTRPVRESDLFGVLAFSPQGQSTENWLTFVNGPSQVIEPGQTVEWWFHPSGSNLHSPVDDRLVEEPHLAFYASHLVTADTADALWRRSKLEVSNVQVTPRDLSNGIQSVQINTRLTNRSNQPIDLERSRAIIWFASTSDQSFLSDNSIRFLYHMKPEYKDQSWPSVVEPGQTIAVNFRVLSDSKSDFFSRTPHVVVIDAPQLPS
ncbi:hypothetical protein [Alicyclobacillus dauci]|uniref:DUF4179 domain-containing protein n=1 Tax=Alicyclobacillus dauci TaxID=1475485 RepID=A0ABY6Z0D5_9BACL|nr:hypothetical protein [Alicyclobacillus dauci]WAH35826.1 hypothetical protein NZD86_16340 [Alicyclobacillus dauci]